MTLSTMLAFALFVFPPQPDAHEIVRKADAAIRARTIEGAASMTVRTPDWERTLDMSYWSVNPDRSFIRITAPAKEAGIATLRAGTNMWNYLPSVERVIKIPPSLMLQPWMGSDFTNDDLVKESSIVEDYTHALQGEVVEAGDPCYVVAATPKRGAAVVWGKLMLWVRKADNLPRKEEYYDEQGKLRKVLVYEDIRAVDGRNYPMRWKMTSVSKPGHETVVVYSDLKFDRPIREETFTRQNLEKRF